MHDLRIAVVLILLSLHVKFKFQGLNKRDFLTAKNSVVNVSMFILLVIKELIKKGKASFSNERLRFDVANEVQYPSLPVGITQKETSDQLVWQIWLLFEVIILVFPICCY